MIWINGKLGPEPSPWTASTWLNALDLALLFGDDDAVTALLAMREALVWFLEDPPLEMYG